MLRIAEVLYRTVFTTQPELGTRHNCCDNLTRAEHTRQLLQQSDKSWAHATTVATI